MSNRETPPVASTEMGDFEEQDCPNCRGSGDCPDIGGHHCQACNGFGYVLVRRLASRESPSSGVPSTLSDVVAQAKADKSLAEKHLRKLGNLPEDREYQNYLAYVVDGMELERERRLSVSLIAEPLNTKDQDKWWWETFEKMKGPAEQFQYLSGLSGISWNDCQDAWFMAKKLIPKVADHIKELERTLDDKREETKELWNERRILNSRIKELEAEVADLSEKYATADEFKVLERERDALEAENKRLRELLAELADLMDDVRAGDYEPDCLTTQPAREALAGGSK